MRYTGPKARLCRREKQNLFGSAKYQKILQRNGNVPGMHGGKRQPKQTEFGKQLREKQKLKRIFGLSEKKFKKYYKKADRNPGITGQVMLQLLERRLDNVLYRAGFALTRMQARQFAAHGLFMLNGRRVTIPSIQVRVGDVVEVRLARKSSPVFKLIREENAHYTVPSWIKADSGALKAEIVALPDETHFETQVSPQMVVEFYSR